MNLEWRLNGESLNNYNYKPGDTINGQIIAVDDQWNGLNITKDFSFRIDDSSAIDTPTLETSSDNTRYSISGHRLNNKPTKPGIYILNGQKIIIRQIIQITDKKSEFFDLKQRIKCDLTQKNMK